MSRDFKKEAEEWANEILKEYDSAEKIMSDPSIKQELDKQLIEFMTLGTLLFKEDENGNRVWIKRL